MKSVVIIGAGLAGLSLATELADEGFEVTVLEKEGHLGGRASNTYDRKMSDPVPIGPHIFLAAYNNFRYFLKKIKAEESISWERRLLFEIIYKGERHQTKRGYLPGPLFLFSEILKYKFVNWKDKLSNLPIAIPILFYSASKIETLDSLSAYDFLKHWRVSEKTINRIWRFFVFSMLNVPLELCSAAEFLLLAKHWSKSNFSKVGFAKVGLGDLYTKRSEEYLKQKGGKILRNASVENMVFKNGQIDHLVLNHRGQSEKITADTYVSTLNPVDLHQLLPPEQRSSDFFKGLGFFEGVPYISVNLWFDQKITHKKCWAFLDDEYISRHLNTDFYDQSNIYTTRKNHSLVTSNIIYSKNYYHLSDHEIVNKTLSEIKEVFPKTEARLIHSEVRRTPYVIYAPYPGMRKNKLAHKTPFSNFYLAGDWTVKELTQCMESAVRSGYYCAEEILKDNGVNKKICNPKIG